MDFEKYQYIEIAGRLLLSLVIGTAIGIEREYKSKAAGLRTMIMICLGSTIFMLISLSIGGDSDDRIASNIITGIGFLGAGVIFKDGLTISGITTATTIWICAALGMVVGAGAYMLSFTALFLVLIVLIFFEKIQVLIENSHQERQYKITFLNDTDIRSTIEKEVTNLNLRFTVRKELKRENKSILFYEIYGEGKKLDVFNKYLKKESRITSFEY